MNGADCLVATLAEQGIDVCFANPGTSELDLVAALDAQTRVRSVLCLAEGVATGAADGFARMADRPAMTLLHCGAGLSYGLANLHNARRARSMIVNCVGDLASDFRGLGSPLDFDIEAAASAVSGWIRRVDRPAAIRPQAVAATAHARRGEVATLILPADMAWSTAEPVDGEPSADAGPPPPDRECVERIAALLRRQGPETVLIAGGAALRAGSLARLAAIGRRTGATILASPTIARMERGGGLPALERVPVPAAAARAMLAPFARIILVGCTRPAGFFSYPDQPLHLIASETEVHAFCAPDEDAERAVDDLAQALDAEPSASVATVRSVSLATGVVTPDTLALSARALLADRSIVVDESLVMGRALFGALADGPAHDWLQNTGGAIGIGPPLATGAAIACPGRRVVNFQADGSALYTLQALWTQARERLDVTTVILANGRYAVLQQEFARRRGGEGAVHPLFDLAGPDIDWCALAAGMGVPATRAADMEQFNAAFTLANATAGPSLIELLC